MQHSLNGFQQCESFICETPKEIASSCHCKRGNLRHAQCNYSHWELPKTTGWHPMAGGVEERGRSRRVSPAVCSRDFDVLSPLSTAHPHSLSGPPSATGEHQLGWRQRRAPPKSHKLFGCLLWEQGPVLWQKQMPQGKATSKWFGRSKFHLQHVISKSPRSK